MLFRSKTVEMNHKPMDLGLHDNEERAWAFSSSNALVSSPPLMGEAELRLSSGQIYGQRPPQRTRRRQDGEHRPRLLLSFRPRRLGREMEATTFSSALTAASGGRGVDDVVLERESGVGIDWRERGLETVKRRRRPVGEKTKKNETHGH